MMQAVENGNLFTILIAVGIKERYAIFSFWQSQEEGIDIFGIGLLTGYIFQFKSPNLTVSLERGANPAHHVASRGHCRALRPVSVIVDEAVFHLYRTHHVIGGRDTRRRLPSTAAGDIDVCGKRCAYQRLDAPTFNGRF